MFKKLMCICVFAFSTAPYILAENDTEKTDFVKIGGALRFNTGFQDYETSTKTLDTYMKLDTWYLTADAQLKGFDVSVQYRFYPEFKAHFFHHAYVGYEVDRNLYLKLGAFQKPFGLAEFASHSWFFQGPYYVGFEDSQNLGLGAKYKLGKFTFDLAYFRQAAPKGYVKGEDSDVGNSRFSYAVINTHGYKQGQKLDANIRELDQFNARVRYQATKHTEFGLSGQAGSIYNETLDTRRWGLAGAAHVEINYNRWNFKGEVMGYNHKAQADTGENLDVIQMGGFGFSHDVASRAMLYVAGLSYTIPINRKFLQSIQTYFDYTYVDKNKKDFSSTHHIIPGILLTMGPIYTHIDCAIGKNHPSLTVLDADGLGSGQKDARWNKRININVGYYF